MTVRVIAPVDAKPPLADAEYVRYDTAERLLGHLQGQTRVVLVSDGLDGEALQQVADAIRADDITVIEVHSERWDGETHSPLTAACRGVIGGFGLRGVAYAVEVLAEED